MASQPRTHNDYTVGWVCALPKELTAATAMLDQTHAELPKPKNDYNTYTLGSIGNHNIVIACLPKGKIGTNPAATAAILMISTFPAVRLGLMVGIGGGIPPHVRLGDVVVSTPTDHHPGVVQWDLGRAEHGGDFKRTGALNNPPSSLLTALAKLETRHEMMGSRIPEILEEMGEKWPRLAPKYLRSNLLKDVLFEPNYDHVSKTPEGRDAALVHGAGDREESCPHCEKSQIIQRDPREMQVHYGLVASGNSVIKDAVFRDKLCQDLGGGVLCVEMEAAGLMDNFPCIVVRGICDYADSHKNKVWQEHAAAVAAAFAKELLGYVQPGDIDGERTVKDTLDNISGAVSAIRENVKHTRYHLDKKEDIAILDWLIPTDYGPQQSDYLRRRQPGTGQWLLDSKEYRNFIKQPSKTLFCPGIPGAGKTILTSIVVDDLEERFRSETTTAVAYIYCNYKRQSEQTLESLLLSLLKQLAQRQPSLPHSLKELYDRHQMNRTRPSLDEISRSLESVARQKPRVFIMVDALDECQVSEGCRQKFLSAVFGLQTKAGVNIFATSRIMPEITEQFEQCLSVEIRATEDDIRRYLQGHISELPKFVTNQSDLQDEITISITKAVEGMFLLAQLHFASLTGKDTPKSIRRALQKLATGSNAYDTAYESAMERIRGQRQEQAERAKQVLSWIVCAKRPLTKLELQHALAVDVDELQLDEDNLPQIEDVVSVCAGLATVDEESSVVRLVHYTTQDYFARTQSKWFPDAQLSITTICTTYLSYQNFANGCSETNEDFDERLRLHPFFEYAARNWGHHGRKVSAYQNIVSFLRKPAQVEASYQALMI
ncbi:nucleoside phosphorylase, partial [Xylariales sp. AK1849]